MRYFEDEDGLYETRTVTAVTAGPRVTLRDATGRIVVTVGDREYTLEEGSTVVVDDGEVMVDGVPLDLDLEDEQPPSVTVVVTGDVGRAEVVGSLTVHGNVTGGVNVTGTMTCAPERAVTGAID